MAQAGDGIHGTDLDGDGTVGMAQVGEATMEMVGDIMVIMAIMFPTITVEEAEVDTTITEVAELQIDQIHHVLVLTTETTHLDHTTQLQDLTIQHLDHKMQHQGKVLIHQEPIRNHLEHHHLEIIALLQEVIITHHQEVHQEEVLVEEVSEAEAEVVLAAEAEEAEEVN